MIPQKRKMYETSIVASDKLATCNADTERAWWRLSLASDMYGTTEITDLRRLRHAILADVQGFETDAKLEAAITSLISAGLMVEWTQPWPEGDSTLRRWLHIVGHDSKQDRRFLAGRGRAKSRRSPVPPFACCEHAYELGMELAIGSSLALCVSEMRHSVTHCDALSRIVSHASNAAPQAGLSQCDTRPSRGEVGRRASDRAAADPANFDPVTATAADLVIEHGRQQSELTTEELFVPAGQRVGSAAGEVGGDGRLVGAAVGPHRPIPASAEIRPDRPSGGAAGDGGGAAGLGVPQPASTAVDSGERAAAGGGLTKYDPFAA